MFEDQFLKEHISLSDDVFVRLKPATAAAKTGNPKVIISEKKKKGVGKMSFEKTIRFCSYFFSRKYREEAKGDIYETRYKMIEDGCSNLAINFVTAFKIFSLILGLLRIRLSDLVKTENEMNK